MKASSHLLPVLLGRDLTAEVASVVHDLQLPKDVDVGRAVHDDDACGYFSRKL